MQGTIEIQNNLQNPIDIERLYSNMPVHFQKSFDHSGIRSLNFWQEDSSIMTRVCENGEIQIQMGAHLEEFKELAERAVIQLISPYTRRKYQYGGWENYTYFQ